MPQLPGFVGIDALYCEASSHSSDEVLCYGSDDEYYESPLVRISCLEEQARRYLEGRRPFLLSASLRGPFDRGVWQNPWLGGSKPARSNNDTSSHQQPQRPASAQRQSSHTVRESTPASIAELGTTPEITVYTDDLSPVSKKRTANGDWLRRTNLKRMRSHDAVPATAPSPMLRRGHSTDYSRSISVFTETDGMGTSGDGTIFSGRQCLIDLGAEKVQDTNKRKMLAGRHQRPLISNNTDRSMSVPADLRGQDTRILFRQSIASSKRIAKDAIVGAEGQENNEAIQHTRRTVKIEQDDSAVFINADRGNDPTSQSNIAEVEIDAKLTGDSLNSPSILPTGQDGLPGTFLEQKPTVEEIGPRLLQQLSSADEDLVNDEADQQLLDELNETDKLNGTETASIKSETGTREPSLQAQPFLLSVENEQSSGSSLSTDTDAAGSVEDITEITSNTGNDDLATGEAEKCDETTLPETVPPHPSLEKAERTGRPADTSAATSQAMSLDVRLWADSVDASVSSSLTNLPTSPCSPEHAQTAAIYKLLVEQVPGPALAVPSSSAPPSTPDTKQSSLPTPDMSVSIKSFRRFRSPTPTPPRRRRPNKPGQPRSILSYPRRKPSGVPGSARHGRRVRFVLPDDDASYGVPFTYTYDLPEADEEDNVEMANRSQIQGLYGSSRTASPPPRNEALTGVLPSEVEKFQEHFASVANRSKQAIHRTGSPEPRNCGPQQYLVTALPDTGSPLQEQRAFGQSQATERPTSKLLDEALGEGDKENQANDWEVRRYGDGDQEDELPVDDVQEVLDNLDDFLGMWNIDAELAQARSEHI